MKFSKILCVSLISMSAAASFAVHAEEKTHEQEKRVLVSTQDLPETTVIESAAPPSTEADTTHSAAEPNTEINNAAPQATP